MKHTSYTRRDFLRNSAIAAGGLYVGLSATVKADAIKKSRVVLIRHQDALDNVNQPNPEVIQNMLNEAVARFLDVSESDQAWKTLFKPTDMVGIKTNNWRYLSTPKPLEEAIRQGVLKAGVPEDKIGLKDWGVRTDPVFQQATALINVRPMRTHHWAGLGSLLKNYILFSEKPSDIHPDTCADLASLWKLPICNGKTRLNILVMMTPLFHGVGPHHFSPEYTWPYKGLLVGTDPVAVDATGLRIIQAKRNEFFKEERPLNPPAKHILLADTRHGLGTADPTKIELIQLGMKEGSYL
jgi:hypothetical protein